MGTSNKLAQLCRKGVQESEFAKFYLKIKMCNFNRQQNCDLSLICDSILLAKDAFGSDPEADSSLQYIPHNYAYNKKKEDFFN